MSAKLISELEALEAELQQIDTELNFYQQILDTAPAVIYVDNTEPLYVKWINDGCYRIAGYTPEHILQTPDFLMQKIEAVDLQMLIDDCIRPNQTKPEMVFAGMYRLQHANDKWCWYYSIATSFTENEKGEMIEDVCISLDINTYAVQNKELEQIIRDMAKEVTDMKTASLSEKEKEVFMLIKNGKTIKEISTLLNKSYHTVENQKRSILRKLGVKRIKELGKFI